MNNVIRAALFWGVTMYSATSYTTPELHDRIRSFLSSNTILTKDNICLSPVTLADAPDIFRCASNKDIVQFTPALGIYPHTTIEETQSLIRKVQTGMQRGNMLWFTIRNNTTGEFIGVTMLWINLIHARAEFGIVLDKPFWSKGIGTLILHTMIDFAFETLRLVRLQAECDPHNIRSKKMLEKAGMKCEGLLRSYYMVRGEPKDRLLYATVPNDSTPALA